MTIEQPFNLKKWIEQHRHLLKPPVGNAQLWKNSEFIVMIVGGPNQRTDYHLDPAPEIFYQLEGNITLKVMNEGKPEEIQIQEGEIFLLPAMMPHSPRRPANTVGMVVERVRKETEIEHFRWYCEKCHELLYNASLHVSDIVVQLPPVFEKFYKGDESSRTCKKCGTVFQPPQPSKTQGS